MRNIALKLMYVGTAYHGWQVQKNAVTVAETLEHSRPRWWATRSNVPARAAPTRACTRRPISPISAPPPVSPMSAFPLAVNTRLPDDIVVVKATEVSDGFNAIGSCLKKEYTYRIYNSHIRNAFYVNRAWFYP